MDPATAELWETIQSTAQDPEHVELEADRLESLGHEFMVLQIQKGPKAGLASIVMLCECSTEMQQYVLCPNPN